MKLTIITINFNNIKGLIKTVSSVINQSIKDYEYIIIDGASTDGSAEYILENNKYFTYWVSEPDNGIYHAMNKGIEVAKGEYCLFLNSGDVLFNFNVLESFFLSSNFSKDIYSGNLLLESNNTIVEAPSVLSASFFLDNSLPHPSTFFRRDRIYFGYNDNFKIAGDLDLILCLLLTKNASYEKIPFLVSIFESSGISNKKEFEQLQNHERKSILNKYYNNFYKFDIFKLREYEYLLNTRRYLYLSIIEEFYFLRIVATPILLFLKIIGKAYKYVLNINKL
jgi:glycosyltransferase involved in cell wall biosynthesis